MHGVDFVHIKACVKIKIVSFVLTILLLQVKKQSFGPIKINLNPDKYSQIATVNFGLIAIIVDIILTHSSDM